MRQFKQQKRKRTLSSKVKNKNRKKKKGQNKREAGGLEAPGDLLTLSCHDSNLGICLFFEGYDSFQLKVYEDTNL